MSATKNKNNSNRAPGREIHTQAAVMQDEHCIQSGVYQGPIPPPSIIGGYAKINPEYPDMIMNEFQKNSEMIRELNTKAQEAEIRFRKRGQLMGFALTFLLLGIAAYAMYLGNFTFAGFSGLAFIGLLIANFLNPKVANNKKDED